MPADAETLTADALRAAQAAAADLGQSQGDDTEPDFALEAAEAHDLPPPAVLNASATLVEDAAVQAADTSLEMAEVEEVQVEVQLSSAVGSPPVTVPAPQAHPLPLPFTAATATEALQPQVADDSGSTLGDDAAVDLAMPDAAAAEQLVVVRDLQAAALSAAQGPEVAGANVAPLSAGITATAAAITPPVSAAAPPSAMPTLPMADAAPMLAEQIKAMVDDDVWQMKLRLDPPRLGRIEVQLAVRDQQVAVSLGSGDAQARMLLAQALPELANALAARGLQLMGADVGHPSQGQDEAPAKRLSRAVTEDAASSAERSIDPAGTRPQGLLDHYA